MKGDKKKGNKLINKNNIIKRENSIIILYKL